MIRYHYYSFHCSLTISPNVFARLIDIAQSFYPCLNDEDIVLLKLFVILYADDTLILPENEIELQLPLTKIHQYCTMYTWSVNIGKTKIIELYRGKVRRFRSFKYGSDKIEVVSDYVYLGITKNYNNKLDIYI